MWNGDDDRNARVLVGHAYELAVSGGPQDLRLAQRAIGRAIQYFMASGMTRQQAITRVIAIAEMLGALE